MNFTVSAFKYWPASLIFSLCSKYLTDSMVMTNSVAAYIATNKELPMWCMFTLHNYVDKLCH